MANNIIQFKRTSTSGNLPNTTNSANGSYIPAGALAVNLTDSTIVSSNGTSIFYVGANVPNQYVSSSWALGTSITANSTSLSFPTGTITTNNLISTLISFANTVTPSNGQVVTYASMQGGRTYYGYDFNSYPQIHESRFVNLTTSNNYPAGLSGSLVYWFSMGGGDTTTRGFELIGTSTPSLWFRERSGNTWSQVVSTGSTITSNLTISGTTTSVLAVGNSSHLSATATSNTITQFTLASLPYGSFEITIQGTLSTGDRHTTKLLVTSNNTTAVATEYGMVYTSGLIFTTDVSYSTPNINILITPTSTTNTTYKAAITALTP